MSARATVILIVVLSILSCIRSCQGEALSLDSTAGFPFYPSTEYGTTNSPFQVDQSNIGRPNIRTQYPQADYVRYDFEPQQTSEILGDTLQTTQVGLVGHSSQAIVGWTSIEEIDPAGNVVQRFDEDKLDLDSASGLLARQGYVLEGPLKDSNGTVIASNTVHSWQRSTDSGEYENLGEVIQLYNNSLLYSFTIKNWKWKSPDNYLNITWSTDLNDQFTSGEAIQETTDKFSDDDFIRVDRIHTNGIIIRQSFQKNVKVDKSIRSVNFTFQPDTNATLSGKGGSLGYITQQYFSESITINSVFNFYYDSSRHTADTLAGWKIAVIVIGATIGVCIIFAVLLGGLPLFVESLIILVVITLQSPTTSSG